MKGDLLLTLRHDPGCLSSLERVETTRNKEPGPDADSWTDGEAAQMAAAGMTNREIAQALFVTVKAVALHLTHVYEKLNITGRAQLPDALGDTTPAAPAQ